MKWGFKIQNMHGNWVLIEPLAEYIKQSHYNLKTLCLSTNMVGKNNKCIYENDIVKLEEEQHNVDYEELYFKKKLYGENWEWKKPIPYIIGKVIYEDTMFMIEQTSEYEDSRGNMMMFYDGYEKHFEWSDYEVIGNIFDKQID
jgi:hypothetical protein